ncbi:MAG TPA: prepilin-type N-terminal cleavage/methylation domain-containing protein [Oceanospirillales bacterium]|nr:prepilin-type N-terminal cleavage/methylation domain-containing protein [Oceanospirillales bacterium]
MKIRKYKNIKRSRNFGFSLIEILVVMTMMAVLMGIVATKMSTNTQKGYVKATRLMIKKLQMAGESFNSDMGYYPKSLDALVNDNGDPNWLGPYAGKKEIKDAWHNEFSISTPGQDGEEFSITSYGKDKSPGGSKFDKDINSWELN